MLEYLTGKIQITNPRAIQELFTNLKATYVFKYAEDVCQVCLFANFVVQK